MKRQPSGPQLFPDPAPEVAPQVSPEVAPEMIPEVPARWAPKDEKEFVGFFMYMLTAPVIVWPGWEDSYRDRWPDVLMNRLAHGRQVFAERMCTEFEAMLFISSATLNAVPAHDWVQVYLWLFARWKPDVAEAEDIKPDRAELNAQQKEKLAELRAWVFKGQLQRLKEKGKPSRETEAERKELEVTQPKLF